MRNYYAYDDLLLLLREKQEDYDPLSKPKNQYDPLWKSILEDTFWHFMEYFFPEELANIDIKAGVKFLDTELKAIIPGIDGKKDVRFVDKLAKVKLLNKEDAYFFVHIEAQTSRGHEELSQRLFKYWYRIFDKYALPVTTLVILADSEKNFHPKSFNYNFMGTKINFKFNSFKILEQDEEALRADPNPFAVVVLTVLLALKNKDADDEKLLDIKKELYSQMHARKMTKDCRKGIYDFLARYVSFEDQKNMFKFEEQLKQKYGGDTIMGLREYLLTTAKNEGMEAGMQVGMEKGIRTGMEKGMAKGKAEGKYAQAIEFARELKKDGAPLELIIRYTKLTAEEIEKL